MRALHPCASQAGDVSKWSLQRGCCIDDLQQHSNTYSTENIFDENPAVTVFADFRISFFRRAPTATFHDSKHNIVHVHFDATRGWLLTSGTDKVIKVGARSLLQPLYGISLSSPVWFQVCPTCFLTPRDLSLINFCPIRTKEVLVYEAAARRGWDKYSLQLFLWEDKLYFDTANLSLCGQVKKQLK